MQYIVLALISCATAACGSLIGAGGGFLLMPILIMLNALGFFGEVLTPSQLTFISLFGAMVNGLAATFNYARMKRIDYKSGIIFGLCTMPVAVLARWLLVWCDAKQFVPAFGVVLLAIGVFILWRRGRDGAAAIHPRSNWTRRKRVTSGGIGYEYAFDMRIGVCASLTGGSVAAFFGISGGILHVPVMTQLLHFPAQIAAATSVMILSASAIAAVGNDMFRAAVLHQGSVQMPFALAAGAGALIGAQIGTRLAKRVSAKRILLLLAIALILVGARLLANPLLNKPCNNKPPETAPSGAVDAGEDAEWLFAVPMM